MANNKRCSGTMGCAGKGPMKKNFGGPVTATERAYNDMKAMGTDLSRATGNAMLGTGMHPYRLIPNDKMKPTAVSKFFQPTNNQVSGERNFAGGNVNEEGPQGEVQGDGGAHARREADARYPVDLAETMVVGDLPNSGVSNEEDDVVMGEPAGGNTDVFSSKLAKLVESLESKGNAIASIQTSVRDSILRRNATNSGEGAGGYTPTPQPALTPVLSADNNRATTAAEIFVDQSHRPTGGARRSLFPSGAMLRRRDMSPKRRGRGSNSSRVVAEEPASV